MAEQEAARVAFDPADYIPGFSDEHVTTHLRRVLTIVEELDPPADLREAVFSVAQQMCAAMQPRGQRIARAAAADGILRTGPRAL